MSLADRQPRFPAIAIIAYIPLGPNPKPMNVYRNCSFSGRSTCINQPTAIAVGLTMVLGVSHEPEPDFQWGKWGNCPRAPTKRGPPQFYFIFVNNHSYKSAITNSDKQVDT